MLAIEAGGIRDHGDGTYEASYVATAAGEVQLIVGLHGGAAKTVFKAACLPATVAPGVCEVQLGMAEITAGQPGQLRFWTADRLAPNRSNTHSAFAHPTCATSLQHMQPWLGELGGALPTRPRTKPRDLKNKTHVACTPDTHWSHEGLVDL